MLYLIKQTKGVKMNTRHTHQFPQSIGISAIIRCRNIKQLLFYLSKAILKMKRIHSPFTSLSSLQDFEKK